MAHIPGRWSHYVFFLEGLGAQTKMYGGPASRTPGQKKQSKFERNCAPQAMPVKTKRKRVKPKQSRKPAVTVGPWLARALSSSIMTRSGSRQQALVRRSRHAGGGASRTCGPRESGDENESIFRFVSIRLSQLILCSQFGTGGRTDDGRELRSWCALASWQLPATSAHRSSFHRPGDNSPSSWLPCIARDASAIQSGRTSAQSSKHVASARHRYRDEARARGSGTCRDEARARG